MSWFSDAFGADEPREFKAAQALFALEEDGQVLVSRANHARFFIGRFETPTAHELRARVRARAQAAIGQQSPPGEQPGQQGQPGPGLGGLHFENIVDDVRALHKSPQGNGAVFQVASQFNALEMVGPSVKPEDGITAYMYDQTQGPACALACPAGTVFRNYLSQGGRGQAGGDARQINLLADAGEVVENSKHLYWRMSNGYALPARPEGVAELSARLRSEQGLHERVADAMRVAVHWSTQVGKDSSRRVTQVYCSALPVAYAHSTRDGDWEQFARTVLFAAFDATLSVAALVAAERHARVSVFLTCIGGGAFGNHLSWIIESLVVALKAHAGEPLDVKLVHFRRGLPAICQTIPSHF